MFVKRFSLETLFLRALGIRGQDSVWFLESSMSCCDKSRDGEEFKRPGPNKVADDSVQLGRCSFGNGKNESAQSSPSGTRNRKTETAESSPSGIDEKVLIDPRLLFIGAKIGEGAHGKVYEGK